MTKTICELQTNNMNLEEENTQLKAQSVAPMMLIRGMEEFRECVLKQLKELHSSQQNLYLTT